LAPKTAIIIGGGPAGLAAAWELLEKTDLRPVVFEESGELGGLAKTLVYKGNRIDIGGHRFFSKSARVMNWWRQMLPWPDAPAGPAADFPMLWRDRVSRILFSGQLFDYPVTLNVDTLRKLGPARAARIGLSYLRARAARIAPEKSLEDFFINRFGRELYRTFFQGYTEKVWGAPCREIAAAWGVQRVRGLSLRRALAHALRRPAATSHEGVETTLIGRFLYPKFGPGQMWEEVGRRIESRGEIRRHCQVVGLTRDGGRIAAARVRDEAGRETLEPGDYFFSSMPIADLIAGLDDAPEPVREAAASLRHRDFITVGVLLSRLHLRNGFAHGGAATIPDHWIYVQDGRVQLGRVQIFNNWSPHLVRDPATVWLGAEYFCDAGDRVWSLADAEMAALAVRELAAIGLIDPADVLDSTVIRAPRAYPAYFGPETRLAEIRRFTDALPNLYLIGRNGMHRYNNQDHSMLTAMCAVEHLISGGPRDAIWDVNTEAEYGE
jgi:protoporphyrinogen oxidase